VRRSGASVFKTTEVSWSRSLDTLRLCAPGRSVQGAPRGRGVPSDGEYARHRYWWCTAVT